MTGACDMGSIQDDKGVHGDGSLSNDVEDIYNSMFGRGGGHRSDGGLLIV